MQSADKAVCSSSKGAAGGYMKQKSEETAGLHAAPLSVLSADSMGAACPSKGAVCSPFKVLHATYL